MADEREAPVAERRLVSVLFADLVGFTTLSESRDPEEVRELLSRYFDTSRRLIARYGGTVEKFIGDAVMAVWGAPTAMEDDAERAVRAALELTAAVSTLGEEAGAPELRARAGVLTGEAAVTLGAEGEGMVAGDLVNTASRIQGAAPPGGVFVGDATKRASDAAIAYEDAGSHQLKGKAEAVQLWRAVRVVGLRGGVMTSSALEPPFVGRDRELRMVKERFHATVDEGRASLVSVIGVGGIGKSRLAWEFEKYFDGLADDAWWHRGRCLAYGDGVAFWALAEMVRSRAGILEDEDSAVASAKLRATVDEIVPDATERRFVEPRLAQLLGLEDRGPGDQANLFSAWRLFFERMADSDPVILLFEDIHWADNALLDFIEHLLDWSRDRPIFILTLSRPELLDRRPTWGAGKRAFTSIFLEPLPAEAMQTLLSDPLPGLPDDVLRKILERAEGVPFYAVETVRMLLDRGVLVRERNTYRATGPIETLEVPETLQALIAARLDGLAPDERRLLQQASVLGRSFTVQGLAAVTRMPEPELEPVLASLVHKEVLAVTTDPMSPERGQYGFLQDLVKKVAYDTMSKRERKAGHLAAAEYLLHVLDEDEIVEVVAAHLLDAYTADPGADDAGEIRSKAREMLVKAAVRAASLGANTEAQRSLEHATELTEEPMEKASLLERAGQMARAGGRADEATTLYERAIEIFETEGATHPAARVSARLAEIMWDRGRLGDGVRRMEEAFAVLSQEEPDGDLATVAATLARLLFFSGQTEDAAARVEVALGIAEAQGLPEVLSQALNTKSLTLLARGRQREALALLRYALDVALEHEIPAAALRAYFNLTDAAIQVDAYREARERVAAGLALARRVGHRDFEWQFVGQMYPQVALGEWDDVLATAAALPAEALEGNRIAFNVFLATIPSIHVHRGRLADAVEAYAVFSDAVDSDDLQERATAAAGSAIIAQAEGRYEDALRHARAALDLQVELGIGHEAMKDAFVEGVEAAMALGRPDEADELLGVVAAIPPGRQSPYLDAQSRRLGAKLADLRGDEADVEAGFKRAAGMLRELETPFWMAVTLVEHGEWLVRQQRADDAKALLDEAREVFERLEAVPWIERVDAVHAGRTPVG
ncbi:MAG TPA: adenylate/guanylate cyclase domain-containing protein [Actinomycetota bacterium]|nr:adenylate/guanylate cyclase domain-containing protein [Actinomycetota bacterium]